MHAWSLSDWMSLEVYRGLLVFVRVGTAFLLLPGFGEPFAPARIRIMAALVVAIGIEPAVDGMPEVTPAAPGIVIAVLAEGVAGALLGILARTAISGAQLAGQIISQNIGITNVMTVGLALDENAAIGAALYAGVLAVLFGSGGHYAVLRSLVGSYNLLPPGQFPQMAASAKAVVAAGAQCFRLGGQLALPFILLSLIFHASLAVVNRAMPSLPVFMLANPVIVVLGLYLLSATLPGLVANAMTHATDLPGLLR